MDHAAVEETLAVGRTGPAARFQRAAEGRKGTASAPLSSVLSIAGNIGYRHFNRAQPVDVGGDGDLDLIGQRADGAFLVRQTAEGIEDNRFTARTLRLLGVDAGHEEAYIGGDGVLYRLPFAGLPEGTETIPPPPQVKWEQNGLMASVSPALLSGRLYVRDSSSDGSVSVAALSVEDGTRLWTYGLPTGEAYERLQDMSVVQDGVFLLTSAGRLVGLEGERGKPPLWTASLPGERPLNLVPADGRVYASAETFGEQQGFLVAYDSATGDEIWRLVTHDEPWRPGPFSVADGRIYLPLDNSLALVDAADGSRRDLPLGFWTQAEPRVVDGDALDGGASGPRIVAEGYDAHDTAYLYAVDASAVPAGGNQEESAARVVIWQLELDYKSGIFPPTVVDGRVYTANWGVLRSVDLETGRLLWERKDFNFNGPVAIVGDTLYVGDGYGYIYAIELRTGRILWQFSATTPEASLILPGTVHLASDGSTLYAAFRGRLVAIPTGN